MKRLLLFGVIGLIFLSANLCLSQNLDGKKSTFPQAVSRNESEDQGLFSQKVIREEKLDPLTVMTEMIEDLPARVIRAEANVGKAELKASGSMKLVEIPVEIYVDTDAYSSYLKEVTHTMELLNFKGSSLEVAIYQEKRGTVDWRSLWEHLGVPSHEFNAEKNKDKYILGACETLETAKGKSHWTAYLVPREIVQLFEYKKTNFSVHVELLDGSGKFMAAQEIFLESNRKHNILCGSADKYFRFAYFSPRMAFDGFADPRGPYVGSDINKRLRRTVTFLLTDDELKRITNIRCTVLNQNQ